MAKLSHGARLLYVGLWCMADDHGRGRANLHLMKAHVFPMDDFLSLEDVGTFYKEIATAVLVEEYLAEGRQYYYVLSWEKHQAARFRRGEPQHPAPPSDPFGPTMAQLGPEDVQISAGVRSREQGAGRGRPSPNPYRGDPDV